MEMTNQANKDHGLLNERFRPDVLENFIGNERLKETIGSQLKEGNIQNMTLFGPQGTGKTTLAKMIMNTLDCDYLYINASDENGIDTIRDKVKGFASSYSFKSLKVVVLDEADFLTLGAQASLRNIIETFSKHTRFILTCNYLERILDKIQSRCTPIRVIPPSKRDIAVHIAKILKQEDIKYEPTEIVTLIEKFYPDIRSCLNHIQLNTKDGVLELDDDLASSSEYINKVIEELKNSKPKFNKIRQILADSNSSHFEHLYRMLFERVEEYLPGAEGSVCIVLNDHLYQSNFAVDKEINIMAALQKIIDLKR